MPALKSTSFAGTVTWLGIVPNSDESLRSKKIESMTLTFAGADGESHSGVTRDSCSRMMTQYPRGTKIRNVRQLTILSEEELGRIATTMGVGAVDPAWLGASIVIRGIPDFTHVPPSSRLQRAHGETTLVVDMENRPCSNPGKIIDDDLPGKGKSFKAAAKGLRGVTAWVECEGSLKLGDQLTLHIPDQQDWDLLDSTDGAGADSKGFTGLTLVVPFAVAVAVAAACVAMVMTLQ